MKEPAPTPNHRWEHLLQSSKNHRVEMRNSLTIPFTRLSLVNTREGYRLYALGTVYPQPNQTLLAADVKKGNIFLQPVLDIENYKTSAPNQDFTLMLERQRLSQVTGVNDYYADVQTGAVLLTMGEKLLRVNASAKEVIASSSDANCQKNKGEYILEARICPSNPKLCSYVCDRKLYIENERQVLYQTPKEADIFNGTASFIEQEELDRFEATWWSPTCQRLLYERVDDREVKTLHFACPGKERTSPMKYPIAGTNNSDCSLRMIEVEGETVYDNALRTPLQQQFPWIEYIGRAGFLNNGKTVWVQVFDRQQQHAALIAIPGTSFCCSAANNCPLSEPTIIYEEFSNLWINTANTIIPLDNENSRDILFLYASERANHCQIFMVGLEFGQGENAKRIFKTVTPPTFSICKSTQSVVDIDHGLVYYVAAPLHCTELAICVSDYLHDKPNYRQLTPPNCSYKGERSYHRLSLIPEFGFVCFITSYNQPPVCHFYTLKHYHMLPEAELSGTVSLYNLSSDAKPAIPNQEDLPQYFKYISKNSGQEHYGMVLMPPGHDPLKTYPVLHYVYGGPGVQIVRNDYTSWISYQKYSRAGYAVVVVDGRGSANRGMNFEAPLRHSLGSAEMEDQVEGLHELARLMDGRLDLDRVIVHGWSYGGFMSLIMLANYPDLYEGAIAGGAVVDWKLYDTAYTERYLGHPVNASYEKCSVLPCISKLPDEPGRLLIVHGFMDENVHFRHIETLMEALLKEGKPYQLQLFPSERHGIRNIDGANHLDATILHFIQSALREPHTMP